MEILVIAALYVERPPRGVYTGIDGVDAWWLPERDARLYAGPWPVVAHPPCERWGRYWGGSPSEIGKGRRKVKGDDGGCFAAALAAVRAHGGVLEHPEASAAWDAFGLIRPPREGGWIAAGDWLGWTCCVEQGHYGHPARKATWLYSVGCELPLLQWGPSGATWRMGDDGYRTAAERAERKATMSTMSRRRMAERGVFQTVSVERRLRAATPLPFRDLLIAMARTVRTPTISRVTIPPTGQPGG